MCFRLVADALPPKQHPILCLITSFGVLFLVSWLSLVCFEARFLALKRFFSYDKPQAIGRGMRETAVSTSVG
jgi:peptidoglycan/LPS O-acetylase OafA/YrhL